MAKPPWGDAPHWGIDGVTPSDTYGSPSGGDAISGLEPRVSSQDNFQLGLVMPVISGSPPAIKHIPTDRSPGGRSRRSKAGRGHEAGTTPGALSKIAWVPQRDLDHTDWLATGRRLGTIGRCSQWWIGDWVRYGTARWGEKYAEAARVTGYDVASLRNMAWVASRFDLSLRNDKLSWSHHVLLAPLEPEEQRKWLLRASEERLSVADLRLELRAVRQSESEAPSQAAPAVGGESGDEVAVCPHCGHSLHSS